VGAVLWACAHIRVTRCTPGYLRAFLAGRLAYVRPALAQFIRALDAGRLSQLCEYIRARQAERPGPVPT
jgi:hypothetical protein